MSSSSSEYSEYASSLSRSLPCDLKDEVKCILCKWINTFKTASTSPYNKPATYGVLASCIAILPFDKGSTSGSALLLEVSFDSCWLLALLGAMLLLLRPDFRGVFFFFWAVVFLAFNTANKVHRTRKLVSFLVASLLVLCPLECSSFSNSRSTRVQSTSASCFKESQDDCNFRVNRNSMRLCLRIITLSSLVHDVERYRLVSRCKKGVRPWNDRFCV